jgi:hypothetical protein
MKNWFFLILGISFSFSVSAQIIYKEKHSIHLNNGFSFETTSILEENGFIIVSKNDETKDDNLEWHFDKYSKNLVSEYTVKVMQNEDLELKNTFSDKDKLHYVFFDDKNHFAFVSFEIENMEILKVFGELPKLLDINKMTLYGDFVYITGELKNKPYACSINWKTGTLKILPLTIENINQKDIIITGIQALESKDEVFIFVNTEVDKEKTESFVFRFNSVGNYINTIDLTPQNDHFLMDITVSNLTNDKLIFSGTYSSGEADCSKGVFFCQTTNNHVDFIKFYFFDQIKDFKKYLTKEQIVKLEEQKNDDEDFLESTRLEYKINMHDIIPDQDGYIFIGEVFYPSYRTSFENYYNDFGTHSRTVYIFEGYKYSHGIVCKLDNQGEMIWSQAFEMDNIVKTNEEKKFMYIDLKTPNEIKIAFPNNYYIRTKSIDYKGNLLIENSSDNIQEIDGINYREIQKFALTYWYDHYFLAYGSIKLVNKNDDDIFHDVFYFDKIEYDHYNVIKNGN